MSRSTVPPLPGDIVEEATAWFVEFSEGAVTTADRKKFVTWLKASPQHIQAYLQVTAHWEDAAVVSQHALPSIDALVRLAREPSAANVVPIGGPRPALQADCPSRLGHVSVSPRGRRYLIAASALLAAIGAVGLYRAERERGVYATDIGEQRSVRLADGSVVELNAHSRIRVVLRERERDVDLIQGQALFQVAKDHARPFVVHSGSTDVLAVGTQFDVNRRRSGTTVTVVEGRVALFPAPPSAAGSSVRESQIADPAGRAAALLHPGAQGIAAGPGVEAAVPAAPARRSAAQAEMLLGAGEQATVAGAGVERVPRADVAAATAWTRRQIVFDSTPLSDAVDEFNRYSTRQLVIIDPVIASTRISGEFSSSNPDSVLKGLAGLNRFTIRELPDRIEISGK